MRVCCNNLKYVASQAFQLQLPWQYVMSKEKCVILDIVVFTNAAAVLFFELARLMGG